MRPAQHRAPFFLRLLASALLGLAWLSLVLSATAAPAKDYLFFSQEDLPGLRSKANSPEGLAVMSRLEAVLALPADAPWKQAHRAAGLALLSQVRGNTQANSNELLQILLESLAHALPPDDTAPLWTYSSAIYGAALSFDLHKEFLSKENREKIAKELLVNSRRLATRALSSGRGAAPDLESASALASAALAALTASSSIPDEAVAMAHARACHTAINQILSKLGNRGWPRESLTTLRRSLSHGLGGFIMAWSRIDKTNALGATYGTPWASLYCTLLLPPSPQTKGRPETVFFGPINTNPTREPAPSWETCQELGGDTLTLTCISDSATRAALLWSIQQCFGNQGDDSLDIHKGSDALFALLGPLLGELPLNPAKTLARVWKDERAGLYLMRNRWEGPNDCITAFHANSRPHPYMPSFADSGSFRLQALGGHWAVRRARDAADLDSSGREKENAIVIPGTHGWLGGRVTRARVQNDGSASITMNLDAVHTVAPPSDKGPRIVNTTDIGIRATRCIAVDYSGNCGAPVMLVVLDQIQNGPSRRWLMHTAEKGVKLRTDGFELRSPNGATLNATIISPSRPRISVSEGRWTDSIAIDGEGNFFIIITVKPPGLGHPKIASRGTDLESIVNVGGAVVRFDGQELAIH